MRVSWTQVFQDYLIDETSSYEKLAEKYKVSKRSIVRHAVKDQWKLKKEQILQKSIQNVTENSIEFLTEVKRKHIELAHRLQDKALEELANGELKIKSASQLVMILKAGIELERKCWEIQVTLDHMQELPDIPSVPMSKSYKENMEKIEQMTKTYQDEFSSWLAKN